MLKSYLQFDIDNSQIIHSPSDLDLEISISVIEGSLRNNTTGNFENVIHTTYTPSSGDKFYFLPGVLVPRVKLKDLYASENIKNVRDISNATHVFCGDKSYDTFIETSWKYWIETDALREFLEKARESNSISDYYYDKAKSALEFYTENIVIVKDYNSIRMVTQNCYGICIPITSCTRSSQAFVQVKDEMLDTFKAIQGLELYSDQSLMPYINGPDSVTIDEAMYQTLNTMFNSSDRDNRVVAMEIMANCNYDESLLYLCVLFHDFGYNIQDIPSKNHVNFKTLINYMGLKSRGLNIDRDDCIDILKAKNRLTVENANYLLNKFSDSIDSNSWSKYFVVKTVCLSPEIDAIINTELKIDIKEDYAPVINETPIQDEPIHNFLNL